MATSGIINVANESQSRSTRVTKEGRRITYELSVIQPPERARACGSGAKSSADRRPVDPPPIVELRIFEGDTRNEITFSYNASFFLYATLENARNIAQGRVAPNPASIPVLTGTPVAGMAYLDRPSPAGYFIFPDLSVRHEGKYRLTFSLFEELKDGKDADPDQQPTVAGTPGSGSPDSYVSYRCDVKSPPFTVFSAKKFPGLTESTNLSRIVAEQGCRVRIRRDVRMRRRDNKHKGEWEDVEEEFNERRRASATPDAVAQATVMGTPHHSMDGSEHARRLSNASIHSIQPRTSDPNLHAAYQNQAYSQPHLVSQAQQAPYPPPMPFAQPNNTQHYAGYAPQPSIQMPPPPQTSYSQPPPPAYQQSQQMAMPQYSGYQSHQQTFAQPEFHHPPSHVRNDSWDAQHVQDQRRNTLPVTHVQHQQSFSRFNNHQQGMPAMPGYDSRGTEFRSSSGVTTPAPGTTSGGMLPNSLPPLKTNILTTEKYESTSPAGMPPMSAPATMHSHLSQQQHQQSGVPQTAMPTQAQSWEAIPPPSTYTQVQPVQQHGNPVALNAKRAYSNVFPTYDGRVSQGQRPDQVLQHPSNASVGQVPGVDASWDDLSEESGEELLYKRADGTQSHRRMPVAN